MYDLVYIESVYICTCATIPPPFYFRASWPHQAVHGVCVSVRVCVCLYACVFLPV